MKSKSVLIIIPHLGIGGTEIQTLNLTRALIEGGYKVTVLSLFRNITSMVEKFRKIGANVLNLSPQYSTYETVIQYPKGLSLIRFINNGLGKALSIVNPDIVHVQYMSPATTIVLLLKYRFRIKNIIATSHTFGDIYSKKSLWLVRFVVKNCLRSFQCITKKSEQSFFGSASIFDGSLKKHFTIYNSLPYYIKVDCEPKIFDKRQTIIGVVSQLKMIKGMDLVIPAFAKVVSQFPDTRLLVVGDGSLRQLMEQQTTDLGVKENVEFVGRQEQDKLQSYYDKIDILLMPSRSEGFGLTAIEGMARGCLPVVADTGGLPEVVTELVGKLHQPESVDDIAAKVIELLALSSSELSAMSAESIDRARQFGFEKYSKQIDRWYNRL